MADRSPNRLSDGRFGQKDLLSRFYAFVQKGDCGCWLWTGYRDKDGYGTITIDGRPIRAHRLAYEINKGEIPRKTLVCHSCDTPSCVNPDHLFLGTPKRNTGDMMSKWRHGRAKLSRDQVVEIRRSSDSLSILSERYGVSSQHISHIRRNKSWVDI